MLKWLRNLEVVICVICGCVGDFFRVVRLFRLEMDCVVKNLVFVVFVYRICVLFLD